MQPSEHNTRLRAVLAFLLLSVVACDEAASSMREVEDAAVTSEGAAPNDPGKDCYADPSPTSHVEIINACTDAERIEKTPFLPLLFSDGSLPPLP